MSDDYYKDGKHIEIQLHRDEEAVKRQIQVQVLISPDMNAAKVFVSGQFDTKQPLNLLLMHPTRKADDQTVKLRAVTAEPQTAAWNTKPSLNLYAQPIIGTYALKMPQAYGVLKTNG